MHNMKCIRFGGGNGKVPFTHDCDRSIHVDAAAAEACPAPDMFAEIDGPAVPTQGRAALVWSIALMV
jgi:hypothetical protein